MTITQHHPRCQYPADGHEPAQCWDQFRPSRTDQNIIDIATGTLKAQGVCLGAHVALTSAAAFALKAMTSEAIDQLDAAVTELEAAGEDRAAVQLRAAPRAVGLGARWQLAGGVRVQAAGTFATIWVADGDLWQLR